MVFGLVTPLMQNDVRVGERYSLKTPWSLHSKGRSLQKRRGSKEAPQKHKCLVGLNLTSDRT